MDPYIANLDLDPPRHSSELLFGLLPAVLLNAAFFGVVLLGSQPGDLDPTIASSSPSSTREMGGPAATESSTALTPTAQVRPADVRAPGQEATTVARADPQAGQRAGTPARVAPSFDCNRARLKTERLVCADAELSQLDRDLARLSAQAAAAAPDPVAYKRQSESAWARREAECTDKACLQRWYAERRAQLQAGLQQGRRQPAGTASR